MKRFTPLAHVGRRWLGAALAAGVASLVTANAATNAWTSASGTDTNWSTAGNWSLAAANTSADDAQFYDAAAVATFGTPNSLVDATVTLRSLHFGQSNNFHTTFVAPGQAINITGAGGLSSFTIGNLGAARNLTNTITGVGGSLFVSNASGQQSLHVGPGRAGCF